jgi:sterol 3beta-glucosyltransferase
MQIVLIASGTRGDVQPMIALGKALKDVGHQVRLVAGSNFVSWIESHGLEAYPTVDIEAVMQSEQGIKWVESKSQMEQFSAIKSLTDSLLEPSIAGVLDGTKGADLIISGFLTEGHAQALNEKYGIPVISCALQPYRSTSLGAANFMPLLPKSDSILNRWMGGLAEWFTWRMSEKVVNALRQRLGLSPYTARSYAKVGKMIPALYAFSRYVVPPTQDTNSYITGYWFFDEPFTPPNDLMEFIKAGEAPVYVGFGSMSSSDPEGTVMMISEALARLGQRGVIARGWSQAQIKDIPDHLFVLDKTSHTWLFPQMSAVVHHGGAGTTAAGLRAGRPSLIVSHLGDQPYWGRRVHELGVGPQPIKRHDLTTDLLTERLKPLLNDKTIRTQAAQLGTQIRGEDGVKTAVHWIQTFIANLPKQSQLVTK